MSFSIEKIEKPDTSDECNKLYHRTAMKQANFKFQYEFCFKAVLHLILAFLAKLPKIMIQNIIIIKQ